METIADIKTGKVIMSHVNLTDADNIDDSNWITVLKSNVDKVIEDIEAVKELNKGMRITIKIEHSI